MFKDKRGKKWLFFYLFFSINFFILLEIILILGVFWGDINLILSDYIGIYLNIVLIIIVSLILPLIYGVSLFFINLRNIKNNDQNKPSKINIILPIILGIVFDLLFGALILLMDQYSYLIVKIVEYYSIYINILICVGLIICIYPINKLFKQFKARFLNKQRRSKDKVTLMFIVIMGCYASAFISPILFIPANIVNYDRPPKPELIAHRGASHLAPENTMEALQIAVEYNASGWEIDVKMSTDGILFLMHDNTLTRTTNIDDVFPDRAKDSADSFTWSELQQLDAGSWFADYDPYSAAANGYITQTQANNYRGVQIPRLRDILAFTRDQGVFIDLDIKGISGDHPFYDKYFEFILTEVIDSNINLEKVFLDADKDERILIEQMNAMGIQFMYGGTPTVEEYQSSDLVHQLIGAADGSYTNDDYRSLYNAGIPIMVHTIDSSERFNQLWCLGVTWVMTNEVHTFNNIKNPGLYMSIENYLILWIIFYLSAISIAAAIKIVIHKRDLD